MSRALRKETTPSLQTDPASDHRATPSNTVPGAAIAHLEPEQRQLFGDAGLQETSVLQTLGFPWLHSDLTQGAFLPETFHLHLILKLLLLQHLSSLSIFLTKSSTVSGVFP